MNFSAARLAVIPFALLACDLPPKDIGKESETATNASDASSESGGPCVDGEQRPSDDGCNTCECYQGEWACTLLACGSEGAPVCEDGDERPADDGCNTCYCGDGQWACTDIGCAPVCEDGEEKPSLDGCNECWCEDGEWGCTKVSCPPFGDEILVCDPGAPQDSVDIESVVVEGDALRVGLAYSGGCETHQFGLCWDGAFYLTNPAQIDVFVSHESHDDPCEAYPHEDLVFDLVPLRQEAQQGDETQHGEIAINLTGWDAPILYTF